MTTRSFFLAGILLLLGVEARAEVVQPPPPGEPRDVKFAQPREKTLANGLRVIVVERPELPLLSVQMFIKSGAEVDAPELPGLTAMTAALLTRGTTTRNATEIAEQIEALGGELKTDAMWDATAVKLRVLSSHAPAALEIFSDVVRQPIFAAEEVERSRREMLDELRVAMEEPRTVALAAAQRVIFGTGGYAHPRSGTLASLERIPREAVAQLHATHFRPQNAVLVFVGQLTAEQGFTWAEQFFGDWKNPAEPLPERRAAAELPKPRVLVIDMPTAGQAAVVVAKPGIARSSEMYVPALVTNSVLGSGYTSRLNSEIRIKRGLSYGARSTVHALAQPGPFLAYLQTKNSAAVQVARLIREQLDLLAAEPVAPAELTPRVSTLMGDFSRKLETNDGWATAIGELAARDRPLKEINEFTQAARTIGPEAIQFFAKQFLRSSETSVVIVGRLESFRSALEGEFEAAEIIAHAELDLDSPTLRRP